MDISIVVPVYGCPDALSELHARLVKTLNKMNKTYEIILVNDYCPKNSIAEIKKLCAIDKNVIGIELARNFGQQRAILAGLDRVNGDYVVVMDCDLQDKPEDIEGLYNTLQEGYDVVFAKDSTTKKKFTSKLFYKVYSKISNAPIDASTSNFSIVKRNVIDYLCSMRETYRAYGAYIRWLGFKTGYYEITRDKRKSGKSGYNFRKRLSFANDIIFSQSDAPVKCVFNSGIILSMLTILLETIFIIIGCACKLYTLLKISSIVLGVLFCLGVNLFAIGIVGMYVCRTFNQVKNRPLYVIRDVINDNKKDKT